MYITAKGKNVSARKPKPLKNCTLSCKNILEKPYKDGGMTYKEHIFNEYWGLADHDKHVTLVCGLVETVSPKVNRTRIDDPDIQNFRFVTHIFNFQIHGKRVHVCKDCFLKTLGKTHSFVNNSLYNRTATVSGTTEMDERGRAAPTNKHTDEKMTLVREHIKSIPIIQDEKATSITYELILTCQYCMISI
mgnify:CR=1 FL=1